MLTALLGREREMDCGISEQQLWSWIDRNAPELEQHLAVCPDCRARAAELRASIEAVAGVSPEDRPPLPERIGSYVIKRLLGEGGMGVVYEAEQQAPRRTVALKVLKQTSSLDDYQITLFRREIEALARLKHPAIAAIYEAGRTEEGQHFFAMELVPGVPLNEYVHQKPLPLDQRLELFHRICEAVDYAHQQDVIHRDLKPSNILIDAEGNPKILDFGLARITDPDATLVTTVARSGRLGGTLPYMSPEQARSNPDEIDVRSDVYSLGVILYEVLTGRLPYDLCRTPLPEALRVICEQTPERPSSIDRMLRGDVETILLKALEKEPARRYQSVGELAADVGRYLSGEPILARPPSRLYVLRKKLSKHRVWVGLGLAAVALGLLGLWGGTWWRDRSLEQQRAQELVQARQQALVLQHNLERGHHEGVVTTALLLAEQYGELPELCLVLAHAYFRVPGGERRYYAIELLEKELRQDPSRWSCAALLAEICRITGDAARAAELEAQLARGGPETGDQWYVRSFATLDTQEALRRVEEAVKRQPKHTLAWERLVNLCLLTGDHDRALDAMETLIRIGEDSGRWAMGKGDLLYSQRRFQEALEQYNALLNDRNLAGDAYRMCAHVKRRLGRYAEAIDDYTTALALITGYPGSPDVWTRYQRATPLWIVGRTEEAAEDYRRVRAHLRRASYGDARLYLILRDDGRHDEAEVVLNDALESVVDNPWLTKIFQCLHGELEPDELIRDALGRDDREHRCEAYYYAGEVCRLSGDLRKARDCFQRCVETGVVCDLDKVLEPMNEYELAEWRFRQLTADSGATSRPTGD